MTSTLADLTTAAKRMRRARAILLGRSRRQGVVRCSWTVAILGGLFFLL